MRGLRKYAMYIMNRNWDAVKICGAMCRNGLPCKAKAVVNENKFPINGRCRMHGGVSSGPKTQEGRLKSREAARAGMIEYWEKRKALKTSQSACFLE